MINADFIMEDSLPKIWVVEKRKEINQYVNNQHIQIHTKKIPIYSG